MNTCKDTWVSVVGGELLCRRTYQLGRSIAVTVTKDPTIVTVLWACQRKYHQFVIFFLEASVTKSIQYSREFPQGL